MNCKQYEHAIALLVTGDLPHRKARRVQRHVDECAACQHTAEALRANHDAVRSLAGIEIDSGLRDMLHLRVFGAIDDTTQARRDGEKNAALRCGDPIGAYQARARGRRLRYATAYAGLAVLIACVAAIGWMQYQPDARLDPKAHTVAVEPNLQTQQASSVPVPSKSQVSEPRIVNSNAREPKQSTVVRLYTDDPRVVFFLVSDYTGG
jgi:hypothetical protein